jgi:hypothetical protein
VQLKGDVMRIRRSAYAASLAALGVAGALVAGCGGNDDDSSTSAALSQSEFVSKATAICQPANKQIEDAANRYLGSGGPPTPQEVEQFADASVIPVTQNIVDGFKALKPPPDTAQTYDALVTELQSVNDRLKADPQTLAQQSDPFAKANQLARQAGLGFCVPD